MPTDNDKLWAFLQESFPGEGDDTNETLIETIIRLLGDYKKLLSKLKRNEK